jgi:hypothetical protein
VNKSTEFSVLYELFMTFLYTPYAVLTIIKLKVFWAVKVMKSSMEIAVLTKAKRPETPMTAMVAISSFVLGLILIAASLVRWALGLFGAYGNEHYSGALTLLGLVLIGLAGHCLDLMERNEWNVRG